MLKILKLVLKAKHSQLLCANWFTVSQMYRVVYLFFLIMMFETLEQVSYKNLQN